MVLVHLVLATRFTIHRHRKNLPFPNAVSFFEGKPPTAQPEHTRFLEGAGPMLLDKYFTLAFPDYVLSILPIYPARAMGRYLTIVGHE